MLGITLQETRVYREAKEEGKEEGKDEERDKIALNLLRENVPLEIVSRTTGLTIDFNNCNLHQAMVDRW